MKWNNQILGHRLVGAANATTAASPIGTATTIRTQPNNNLTLPSVYVPVRIKVDTNGLFSLAFNNNIVYTNLPIFRPVTDSTLSLGVGSRFGFGARTGGSTDDHWIDNLGITTITTPTAGQPFATQIAPYGLANQGAGSPASAVGGVTIRLQDSIHKVDTNTIVLRYNNTVVTPNTIITRVKSAPEVAAEDVTLITYYGADGIQLPVGQVQFN